jgi:hypothetical protein
VDDDGVLARIGAELAQAVERAVPAWVVRSVVGIVSAYRGAVTDDVVADAQAAGERAAAEVGQELRALLTADVDDQRRNPLDVVRAAVVHPTAVLRRAGVPAVVRDEFDERHFPDDDYGLTPLSFADVDPALQELGIIWGATKARAHLLRHRRPAGEP